ncbi:aspartyl-tRNA amidotransferase subunit B [Agarivorans gilvus]|uniref:Aspartyl-tRNA amidotransferase subunit B n=2 Tax=Agarivorans gilvus TaxID=680279 RepID=A0ABQ1I8M2_9ALTE|nr:aspartyl-tRNA amidotransferase subunit B [Agarivorans gilvus]
MDKFFDNFYNYKKFGPAKSSKAVPAETINRIKGKLPDKLLEYWQEYGWSSYENGLFWTVNPDDWEPALEAWIGDTEFMEKDAYYVIARSAFVELFLWGTNTGDSLSITPNYAWLNPNFNMAQFEECGEDRLTQMFFSVKTKEHLDFEDEKPLFEKALNQLGELEHDTMYGFVPALALGGQAKLENLQKVSAVEHLVILAGLSEKKVMLDVNDI